MQKSVNQWLDFLDTLPENQRKNKDIESFQNQLINIKMDLVVIARIPMR